MSAKPKSIPHDQFLKRSLLYPRLITSFIENYLDRDLIKSIDFQSGFALQNNSISKGLYERRRDITYQVSTKSDQPFIIHIENEIKSTPHLGYRCLVYSVLLMEDKMIQNSTSKPPTSTQTKTNLRIQKRAKKNLP